jgi:hypothetical protein
LFVAQEFIVTHNTSFIATAPNVVIAAAEAGLMSIAHLNIPYVEVNDTEKLSTLRIILADEGMRRKAAKELGLPKIETVAIDTLDAWQEIMKRELLSELKVKELQGMQWSILKERMAAILKAFIALPMNIIFTVHTTTNQDDEGKLIYTPNLQGAIKESIAGMVDFSLLAFRQRETDNKGLPKINYYLKCEGDQKNPSLGNRAAGRLPEVCNPNFKVLHDAVFKGFTRNKTEVVPISVTFDPPSPVQPPVQADNAAPIKPPDDNAVPADLAEGVPQATGVPVSDNGKQINAAGLTMLTKSYKARGLVLPPDIESWTLGKARSVAKYFMAWTADQATGKEPSSVDLADYLKAVDAWAGSIDGVQVGVSNIPVPPKPPEEPEVAEVATPAAEKTAEVPAETDEVPSEEEAVKLIGEQLGGVLINRQVEAGAKCEVCGEVVDDVDVAQLAQTRFRKILCIKHYKQAGPVSETVSV